MSRDVSGFRRALCPSDVGRSPCGMRGVVGGFESGIMRRQFPRVCTPHQFNLPQIPDEPYDTPFWPCAKKKKKEQVTYLAEFVCCVLQLPSFSHTAELYSTCILTRQTSIGQEQKDAIPPETAPIRIRMRTNRVTFMPLLSA